MGADGETWARRDWSRVAVGAALVMLGYFTLINHVDVYPLNNLSEAGSQWSSTLAGWVQFTIFSALIATRHRVAVFASLVISVVWLVLQFVQWWVPYLSGRGDHSWYTENGYDETWRILPSIQDHVVIPDLQHNVLQLLSLGIIAAATAALIQAIAHRRAFRPEPGSSVSAL